MGKGEAVKQKKKIHRTKQNWPLIRSSISRQLKIGGERSSASQFPGGTTTSIYGQFFPLRCQRRRSATHLGTLLTALLARLGGINTHTRTNKPYVINTVRSS